MSLHSRTKWWYELIMKIHVARNEQRVFFLSKDEFERIKSEKRFLRIKQTVLSLLEITNWTTTE